MNPIGGTDSWKLVKDYLQDGGIIPITDEDKDDEDEMSYHDPSYDEEDYISNEDDEEEFDDEMEDEEDEEENEGEEEEEYSDYEIQEMEHQQQSSEPEIPSNTSDDLPVPILEQSSNPSIATIPVIPEPITIPLLPSQPLDHTSQQTQSPPITPDQPPHPRKRLFLETQDPTPLPTPTRTSNPVPVPVPEEQAEPPSKRRRVDEEGTGQRGWLGVAKTIGKYTVAGAVGGAATFLGLSCGLLNSKNRIVLMYGRFCFVRFDCGMGAPLLVSSFVFYHFFVLVCSVGLVRMMMQFWGFLTC